MYRSTASDFLRTRCRISGINLFYTLREHSKAAPTGHFPAASAPSPPRRTSTRTNSDTGLIHSLWRSGLVRRSPLCLSRRRVCWQTGNSSVNDERLNASLDPVVTQFQPSVPEIIEQGIRFDPYRELSDMMVLDLNEDEPKWEIISSEEHTRAV